MITIGKRTTKKLHKEVGNQQARVEGISQGASEGWEEEESFWEVEATDLEIATLLYEAFKPLWGC